MKKSVKGAACAVALTAAVVTGSAAALPSTASAMVVYDPTNHTETLASKLQLIKSYEKQLEQYKVQLQQLAKLDGSQVGTSIKEIQSMVTEMNNIRTSVGAIGTDFKKAAQEFENTFTDYSKWSGASAKDYVKQTDKINAAVDDGIKQSILAQGLASPEEMQKTADSLSTLLEASQNADGIVGVTQAASQISALQIKELQRLEAIMTDSLKGQNLYLKKKMQAEEAAKQRSSDFAQLDSIRDEASVTTTARDVTFDN